MDTLKNQNTLIAGIDLKNKVEEKYGIYDMDYYLFSNTRNTIYLLKNEVSKYIFKVYDHNSRSLQELKTEVELVDLLHRHDVSVSYPISDENGSFIQSFLIDTAIYYGVLNSFAEGQAFNILNDAQTANAGIELAKLHLITSGLELNHQSIDFHFDSVLMESLQMIKPAFRDLEEEYEFLVEASKQVLIKLKSFDLSELPSGYCHFDFLPANFHFTPDNNIVIFDFDMMRKGALLLDIVTFFGYHFFSVLSTEISNAEANSTFNIFLDNYRKIRGLSDLEIQLIPYFFFGRIMAALQFRIEHQIDLIFFKGYVDAIRLFLNTEILK